MSIRLSYDRFIIMLLSLVIVASVGDLIADLSEGVNTAHLIQEGMILLFASIALSWLIFDRYKKVHEIKNLLYELEELKKLPQPNSKDLVDVKKKLAEVIAQQFNEWQLTDSEKEVGQLLLKGFSLKEVSTIRGTAENTIRQQASSIYTKSGIPGRHALAAWFIEDYL